MEDVLSFKETDRGHWHANFNELAFDIERKPDEYELTVEGENLHECYHCNSLDEAKEKAMKYTVW